MSSKKMKGKAKAKVKGGFIHGQNLLEKAQKDVEELKENYVEHQADNEPDYAEDRTGMPHRKLTKNIKFLRELRPVVVLDKTHIFVPLRQKDCFPLHKIQDVVRLLGVDADIHLLFSGIQQITDAVFAVFLKLKDDSFNTVTQINLAGCHHITDRGVFWLTLCFQNLDTLNLMGCINVTEGCLTAVMRNCKNMANLTLTGTSVSLLPAGLCNYRDVTASCLPLASPALEVYKVEKLNILKDVKFFKKPDNNVYKVLIVRRQAINISLLKLIKKEKDLSVRDKVTCDLNYKHNHQHSLTLIECQDSVVHLFSSRRTCFVLPYDCKDKSKLKQEAASIAGFICELTAQAWPSHNTYTLVGLNTSKEGVVPADVLKEEVVNILTQITNDLTKKLTDLTDPKKNFSAGYSDQENLSRTKALISGLSDITLTAIEVNTEGKDLQKEANVVLETLSTQISNLKTKSPETAEYANTLHTFCLSSEPIKMDVSSLESANESLAYSKNKLTSQGALNFLHVVGKVCYLYDSDGSCIRYVVKTTWLVEALNLLMGPTGSMLNSGAVAFVADETPIWERSQLEKAFEEHKLNTSTESSEALELLMSHVGVDFSTKAFISLNHLKDKPPVAVDKFTSTKINSVCEVITYTCLMSHQLPVPTMHQLLTSCLKLHSPIMLWSMGCVVHDGIVEIVLQLNNTETENSSLTLQAQTVKTENNSATLMLWNTLEQYKLILDSCLARAGISVQFVCEHNQPKPDSATGLTQSHIIPHGATDQTHCELCTTTTRAIRLLQASKVVVSPSYLEAGATSFEPESCGHVEGSSVVLTELGTSRIITTMSAFDNSRFAATVLSMPADPVDCFIGLGDVKIREDCSIKYNLAAGRLEIYELGNIQNIDVPKITSPGVVLSFRLSPLGDLGRIQLDVGMGNCPVASVSILGSCFKPFVRVDKQPLESKTNVADKFEVVLQGIDFIHSVPIAQPGMRLEALNQRNPTYLSVATLAYIHKETGEWQIHLDGMSDRYDYTTNPSSAHLHPLGYMAFIGHKHKQYRPELQPPHKYDKPVFDWAEYLKDLKEPPMPWELFSEEQKEGTPPDETNRALQGLGMFFDVAMTTANSCSSNRHRGAVLEKHIKLKLSQTASDGGEELNSFISSCSTPVCVLPAHLDLSHLRYPPMTAMFNPSMQHLHFLCPGLRHDYHLVDHEGISFSKVSKTYAGIEAVMMMFLQTLYFQENILPAVPSNLCPGAETISVNQKQLLQPGVRRLLRLYMMMFEFLTDGHLHSREGPAERKDKENSETLSRPLREDKTLKISLANLLEKLKKDDSFLKSFSMSRHLQCLGHHLAISPSCDLTEVTMKPYTGVAHLITKLDFQNNSLATLPDNFFESFPHLVVLLLARNSLTSLPSLAACASLAYLDVSHNKLATLTDLEKVKDSLTTLIVTDNPFGKFPENVVKCTSLDELQADNVGLVPSLEEICEKLQALKKLSLNYNKIEKWPWKFPEGLVELGLAGVPFVQLSETTSTFTLMNFNTFIASNVMLSNISQQERIDLYSAGTKKDQWTATSTVSLAELNARLSNLKLYSQLGRAELAGAKDFPHGIPASLFECTSLEKLNLSNHAFKKLPDHVHQLTKLSVLDLSHSHQLESISAELATLPLTELHLKDCPVLKTPPKEIVARGFTTIFGYLRRLRMGSVPCKRTKLMMVGLGGAGKTSLVRALTMPEFQAFLDYGENITDGIDISEWVVPVKDSKEPITYSVWDFAGQTVYYNTHQFFLSNRAVYLLLWNIRLGYEHAGLNFWLSSIACHAPLAPILVVGTHCDKVEKTRLPTEEIQRRFPQICGFHYVSSYSGEGVPALLQDITRVTLEQKYMGEQIPEAWLSLEKRLLKHREEKKDLLPWRDVEKEASACGLIENVEIYQGVQFLHDLGSVQFFNTDFLRSQIVIYPQWIVDVMACVVTVHVGPIQNGKFLHSDMAKVWKDYPLDLHPWLLRLTEEFDLTFPLPDEDANIVPCLLPTTEPKYTWPAVDKEKGFRETKMIYVFDYLPAGLFNRAQVRLHEFSSESLMWKKGSLLNKNNHKALLLQTNDTTVVVKVQGFKPENVLFLVHEVFESLVQQSYSGVHYDFAIPCMDCQAEMSDDPCMFSASKIHRAVEMKAPFLQCDSSFHILAIPELQAVMPPDRSADFDEHLGRSVRELRDLEEEVTVNTFFLYSKTNIPSLEEGNKLVHPGKIIEDLRASDIKISFCDNPETADMETLTLSLKTSQVVMIGISDEFVENEQCKNLIAYTKETLHKPILLAVLGKTTNWRNTNLNILLADEVFVKLQDLSRYESKKCELVEKLKLKAGHLKKTADFPKCFISYCWANSKMAKETGSHSPPGAIGWGDPRKIKEFLESKGISCWLDVERMGTKEGFFEDIAEGLRKAKVMVSCVSNEYAVSSNCRMEFRFGVSTLRIPVILAVVGAGYKWDRSEVGLMAAGNDCPKVNLQYENEAGMLELFALVQDVLSKTVDEAEVSENASDMRKTAFQEVLELAQRKFLRHLENYASVLDREAFPNLLTIDLVDDTTVKVKDTVEVEVKDNTFETEVKKLMEDKTMDPVEKEDKLQKASDMKKEKDAAALKSKKTKKVSKYCFKLLCEFEQGWHSVPEFIPVPDSIHDEDSFLKSVAPYLVRLFAILKHTSVQLSCLTKAEGEQMRKQLEEWCTRMTPQFEEEYTLMLKTVMEADTDCTLGGLKRCHVTNGKVLWLCREHQSLAGSKTTERYRDQLESVTTKQTEQKPEATQPNQEAAEKSENPIIEEKHQESVTPKPLALKRSKLRKQTSQACVVM